MMTQAIPIQLSDDERSHVQVFVRRGKANARTLPLRESCSNVMKAGPMRTSARRLTSLSKRSAPFGNDTEPEGSKGC